MATISTVTNNGKFKYSKSLSSLFSSSSVILLSFLSLLNNLSLDFYGTCILLKIVIPASICFWVLGFVIGHILDNSGNETKKSEFKLSESDEAYSMPSMFSEGTETYEDNIEEL